MRVMRRGGTGPRRSSRGTADTGPDDRYGRTDDAPTAADRGWLARCRRLPARLPLTLLE